jgi:hypothetical protein
LNQKKVATIILLTLVLTLTFIFLNPTLAQTSQEQKQKTETLLNILTTVNASIAEETNRFTVQNIPVPQAAKTNFNEGATHAEEAANLMNMENYAEASVEAVEAMKKFKETLLILQEASPIEITETVETAVSVINMRATITRAYEYVERLENLTARARTAGYNNTTTIDNKLSIVKEHLENATEELDKLNLDSATEQLRGAKTILEELKMQYDTLVNRVKLANTRRYLEEITQKVDETKTNVTNSATLSTQNKTNALSALNNSQSSLEKAGDYIDEKRVDDAISELEDAKKWIDESSKYLSISVATTPDQTDAMDKNLQRTDAALTTN